MGNHTFTRTRKILGVLLLVSLVVFVTVSSASAKQVNGNYQTGYQAGSKAGYKVGYNAGHEDCLKHGQNGVLTKIPSPAIKDKWSKSYTKGYKEAFKKAYISGYNKARFKCLKK
jgi:flagellar biosynthesis/type III secretory pathway protein FliH